MSQARLVHERSKHLLEQVRQLPFRSNPGSRDRLITQIESHPILTNIVNSQRSDCNSLGLPLLKNASQGRDYYFKHIHTSQQKKLERVKETNPFKKGYVPYSTTEKPSIGARMEAYMKKFDLEDSITSGLTKLPSVTKSLTIDFDQMIQQNDIGHQLTSRIFSDQSPRTSPIFKNPIAKKQSILQESFNSTQINDQRRQQPRRAQKKSTIISGFKEGLVQLEKCDQLSNQEYSENEFEDMVDPLQNRIRLFNLKTYSQNQSPSSRRSSNKLRMRNHDKTPFSIQSPTSFNNCSPRATILQESNVDFVARLIKEFSVYLNSENEKLSERAERVFRKITEIPNQPDIFMQKFANLKVDKHKLKKYLQLRYSAKIAQKIVVLFDFNMMFYKEFFKQVFEIFIKQSLSSYELLENAIQFAFSVYDLNCDGVIDRTDLFTFIREVKNEETFSQASYRDIQDIQTYLNQKQKDLDSNLNNTTKIQGFSNNLTSPIVAKKTINDSNAPEKKLAVSQLVSSANINLQEFCQINFTFGFPLVYLDFIECMTGENLIQQLHQKLFPADIYNPLIQYDTPEMNLLRSKIDERFYPLIIIMFDKLGEVDQEITKDWNKQEKETKQFITYASLQNKLYSVFKVKNQMFAKMLFLYLSGRRSFSSRINYKMFLQKLMPFWLKTVDPSLINLKGYTDALDTNAKKERIKQINIIVFEMINMTGEKSISILSLLEICANIPKETAFGYECYQMLSSFTAKNLRPRFNPRKLVLDFAYYCEVYPKPCLAKELEHILCEQYMNQINKVQVGENQWHKGFVGDARLTVIQDETDAPEAYFEKLEKYREFYQIDQMAIELVNN